MTSLISATTDTVISEKSMTALRMGESSPTVFSRMAVILTAEILCRLAEHQRRAADEAHPLAPGGSEEGVRAVEGECVLAALGRDLALVAVLVGQPGHARGRGMLTVTGVRLRL